MLIVDANPERSSQELSQRPRADMANHSVVIKQAIGVPADRCSECRACSPTAGRRSRQRCPTKAAVLAAENPVGDHKPGVQDDYRRTARPSRNRNTAIPIKSSSSLCQGQRFGYSGNIDRRRDRSNRCLDAVRSPAMWMSKARFKKRATVSGMLDWSKIALPQLSFTWSGDLKSGCQSLGGERG